jgi:flavodoxin
MKALVVYDSTWGNTEKIAQAIAAGMGAGAKAARVGTMEAKGYDAVGLLVLGSPILGGRPSEAMQRYIDGIPRAAAERLKAAAFDTRLSMKFVKIFGFAAVRMAEQMKGKGSVLTSAPEGFYVRGREGPLAEGETERATSWGKKLAEP